MPNIVTNMDLSSVILTIRKKITGYSYEPWHIRYVGTTVAAYLYKNNLTLEEYYGVTLKDMEDSSKPETSVDVEDPDSVVYATPKPTKKPKDKKKDKKRQRRQKAVQNRKARRHQKSPRCFFYTSADNSKSTYRLLCSNGNRSTDAGSY